MSTMTAPAPSYGLHLQASLEARVAELLDDLTRYEDRSVFPMAYDIEDIRERDDEVEARVLAGDFDGLRRSMNGRELLALWQVRSIWRERNSQPQDEYDGFAPQTESVRELANRAEMHDQEFEYLARFDMSEDQYLDFERQDAWTREQTEAKRAELIEILVARGVNCHDRSVRVWVEKRMRAKSWNRLRAYSSCIYIIRRGFFTGFKYEGWVIR